MPAGRVLPFYPGSSICVPRRGMMMDMVRAKADRDKIAMVRKEMPEGDPEAISWIVRRLMMIASERKVRMTSKFQWRGNDPESLFVAMERGIDNDVADRLGEVMRRRPLERTARQLSSSKIRNMGELVSHVRSLRTDDDQPITSLEEWCEIDSASYRLAKKWAMTREVCRLLSLSYRVGGGKPPLGRVGRRSIRYPREKAALKAFLIVMVRSLARQDGSPVESLGDWRTAHEGSYAKALANGLQREICEELKLHVTKNITRASPRKSEDQNPA